MQEITYQDVRRYIDEYRKSKPLPRISCLIPTYQRDYIIRMPLVSLLNQDYPGAFDILVLDDGADKTAELIDSLKDPRIRHIRLDRQWIGDKCNHGIEKESDAEFFILSGSDDFSSPIRLSIHMFLYLKYGIEFSGTNKAVFVDTLSEKTILFDRKPIPEAPLTVGTTFGFSRNVWQVGGGFAKGWHKKGNDIRFITNVIKSGNGDKIQSVDDYFPRFHEGCICFQHNENIWYRDFSANSEGTKSVYFPCNILLKSQLGRHYDSFKEVQKSVQMQVSRVAVCIHAVSPHSELKENILKIKNDIQALDPENELWVGSYNSPDRIKTLTDSIPGINPIIIQRQKKDYLLNLVTEASQKRYVLSIRDNIKYGPGFFKHAIDRMLAEKDAFGITFYNTASTEKLPQPLALSFSDSVPESGQGKSEKTAALDFNHCIFNRLMFREIEGLDYMYERDPWAFIDCGFLASRHDWRMIFIRDLEISQENSTSASRSRLRQRADTQGYALLFVWKNFFSKDFLRKTMRKVFLKSIVSIFRLDLAHFLGLWRVVTRLYVVGSWRKRQREKIRLNHYVKDEAQIINEQDQQSG